MKRPPLYLLILAVAIAIGQGPRPAPAGIATVLKPLIVTEYVNVRDYGAKGDGKADEGPAVRKAVASLVKDGGGTLLFPPGVYRLTTPDNGAFIRLVFANRAPVRLVGYGGATLWQDSAKDTPLILLGSPNENDYAQRDVTIEGLSFRANRRTAADEWGEVQHASFIHVAGASDVTVRNCRFEDGWNYAVYFKARGFNAEGNYCRNVLGGIQGIDSERVRIVGNRFEASGVACDDQLGIFASATGRSFDVLFADNTIDKGYRGRRGTGDPQNRGYANSICIAGGVEDVTVRDNRLLNVNKEGDPLARGGVLVRPDFGRIPRRVAVTGNLIRNVRHALYAEGDSEDLLFAGNTVIGTEGEAVRVVADHNRACHAGLTVTGNRFADCGGGVVVYNAPAAHIEGNSFRGMAEDVRGLGGPDGYVAGMQY
jgi:polygalacturonase